MRLIGHHESESVRSVQLYGVDPKTIAEAITMLVAEDRADHIDLNFGCPVPKVTRKGGGSALPWKSDLFGDIVRAAVDNAQGKVPVTVKMRVGIDDGDGHSALSYFVWDPESAQLKPLGPAPPRPPSHCTASGARLLRCACALTWRWVASGTRVPARAQCYDARFLASFPALPPTPLSCAEDLEQLRVLWHGERIAVHVSPERPGPGVDTPEDLGRLAARSVRRESS